MTTTRNRSTAALVLAAGLGTRLRPLTDELPKPAIPIMDRPVIEYVLRQVERAGITRIFINTHWHREVLKHVVQALGTRSTITWVDERELLGSAGTTSLVFREHDVDDLLICPADLIHDAAFDRLIDDHLEHRATATILSTSVPGHWSGDRLEVAGNEAVRYAPSSTDVTMPLGTFGVACVNRSILEFSRDRSVLSTEVFPAAATVGALRAHSEIGIHAIDIGSFALLADAVLETLEGRYGRVNQYLSADRGSTKDELISAGHFVSGPAFVSRHAELRGPISLHGPVAISSHVVVGEGAHIERSVLLPGAVVPPKTTMIGGLVATPYGLRRWADEQTTDQAGVSA